MKRPQVLIIGLGGVGSWILELLARTEGISRVVGADYNEEWGRKRLYTAASGVVLQGYYPDLEFVRIDLQDVNATAETISRLDPRMIINCTTLQTWWVRYQHLSPEKAKRLGQAGAGPWLPTHLALARKLMLAIQASGWQGFVIRLFAFTHIPQLYQKEAICSATNPAHCDTISICKNGSTNSVSILTL